MKTSPKQMTVLFQEFKNDFVRGAVPDYTESAEAAQAYKAMVERYCELLAPFDANDVRSMFVSYLQSGGNFFPKVGDLTKHKPKPKPIDELAHIPDHERTAEIIRERERMIEEAQAMNTPEHQERMREYYAEAAKRLGIETDENSTDSNRKFGSIRFDFNTE